MSSFPLYYTTMSQVKESHKRYDEQLLIPICLMTTSPTPNTNQSAPVALSSTKKVNVPSNVMQVISVEQEQQQQEEQQHISECQTKRSVLSVCPSQTMTTPIVTTVTSSCCNTPQNAYLETRPCTQQVTLPQNNTLPNQIYQSHPVYICSSADNRNNIIANNSLNYNSYSPQNCALQMYTPISNAHLANQCNEIVANNAQLCNNNNLNCNNFIIALPQEQKQEKNHSECLVQNKYLTLEQKDNNLNNKPTPQYNATETNIVEPPMLQFINANYSVVNSNNINYYNNDANNIIDSNRNDNSYSVSYYNCAQTSTKCNSVNVTPSTNPLANNMTAASSETTVQGKTEPAVFVNSTNAIGNPLYYTVDTSSYNKENSINVESTSQNVSLPVLQIPVSVSYLPQTQILPNHYNKSNIIDSKGENTISNNSCICKDDNNFGFTTNNFSKQNVEPFTLVHYNSTPAFSHTSLLPHPSSANSASIQVHQAHSSILPLTRSVIMVQGEHYTNVKTPATEPSVQIVKNKFVAGKWYEGVVKRYNPQRGYGFVTGTSELRVNAMYCDEMCLCNAERYLQSGSTHSVNVEHDLLLFSPQWHPSKLHPAQSSPKVIMNLSEVRCEYVEPVETAELSLMQWIIQTADSKGLVKRLYFQEQSIPAESTYSHIHDNKLDEKVNTSTNNAEMMKTSHQYESDRSTLLEPLGSIFVHHTSLSIRGFRALEVNSLVRFSVDVVQGTLQAVDVIPLQQHSSSLSSLISATAHLSERIVDTENDTNMADNNNKNSSKAMLQNTKGISNCVLEELLYKKEEEQQQISTHALLPPPFVMTKTAEIVLMNKLAQINSDREKYKTNISNIENDSSCKSDKCDEECSEKQGLNTWNDFVIVPSAAIPSALIAKSVLETYRMSQVDAL